MFTIYYLVKYVVLFLIFGIAFKYTPGVSLSNKQILLLSSIVLASVVVADLVLRHHKIEKMSVLGNECQKLPKPHDEISKDEAYVTDNVVPGIVPYENASDLISKSVLDDLQMQHNHEVIWSPHTHIGKGRGHLSWEN
jgi:hypothetical protein